MRNCKPLFIFTIILPSPNQLQSSEVFHVALLQLARDHGLGVHITVLEAAGDYADIMTQGRLNKINETFSITTSYFGRMSFAVFMLSVIGRTERPRRIVLWSLVVVDTIINVVVIVQIYTQCGIHVDALWNQEVARTAYCLAAEVETYLGYAQASLNSICDLVLTILPITVVARLQMNPSTKYGLLALLTLSIL